MAVNKKIIYIALTVTLLLTVVNSWMLLSPKKMAWFDIDKVYNEFLMKKDLEKKVTTLENARQFYLDSLKYQIKALENSLIAGPGNKTGETALGRLYDQYEQTEEEFYRSRESTVKQYNTQVLNNIREMGKKYAAEKGLEVFAGISTGSDLIFCKEGTDRTTELIEYLNSNYKGE